MTDNNFSVKKEDGSLKSKTLDEVLDELQGLISDARTGQRTEPGESTAPVQAPVPPDGSDAGPLKEPVGDDTADRESRLRRVGAALGQQRSPEGTDGTGTDGGYAPLPLPPPPPFPVSGVPVVSGESPLPPPPPELAGPVHNDAAGEDAGTVGSPGLATDIAAGDENGHREPPGQADNDRAGNGRYLIDGRSFTNGNGPVNGNGLNGMRGLTNGNGAINGNGLVGARGLTNGKGAVNGNGLQGTRSLVNGNGAVNGNGLISNQGLINGNGLINGQGRGRKAQVAADPAADPGSIRTRKRRRNRLAALVAIAAVAVVMLPVLAVILHPAAPRMSVDGNFGDWQGMPIISDGPDPSAPSPDLDIVRYSTTVSGDSAFFYIEVAGRMLSGKISTGGIDAVNVFLDIDQNATTGYTIHGIGADLRLEAHGWNGQVQGCTMYKFSPKRAGRDWNGWSSVGGFSAVAQGSKMEMAAARGALGIHGPAGYKALFQIMDSGSGAQDLGKVLAGPSGGALYVSQSAVDDIAAIPVPSENQHILTLGLTAFAGDIQVRELVFTRCGNLPARDVGVVRLVRGQNVLNSSFLDGRAAFDLDLTVSQATPLTLELYVEIFSSATAQGLFGADLAGNDAVVLRRGTATVAGAGEMSYYVGATPTTITIDGAFGDWRAVKSHADPAGDCPNADVDLLETRATKDSSSMSVLARVDGSMLGGASSPETPMTRPVPSTSRPSGPSPVQPALPVLMALDTVKVFIDSDDSALTGYRMEGLDLGADYALVVTGAGGNIIGRDAYSWSNATGDWKRIGAFAAAKDPTRMEMQAPLALLGLNATAIIRVQVYASDWTGNGDHLDQSIVMADPLQLTSGSTIFYSSDANSWTNETTISQWGNFTDLCNDSSGYQYALNNSGAVYRSTGNWSSWTKIINATLTNATAVATNGTSFYAIETDGDVYNTTSGRNWTKAGNITANNDTVDMCIDTSGNLYAVRSDPNDTVFNSSNGGKNWTGWGNRTVGAVNLTINNSAIVYGPGWGGTKYIFVLQTNGDIRYDTNGTTSSPWRVINSTDNASNYVDLASNSSSGGANNSYYLWVLKLNGTVFLYKFDTTAPNGTWTTNLTRTNVSDACAISVNLVPEFKDALLPMTGMIAVFILIRSRRPKRSER